MPDYKLIYFNAKARAEVAWFIFAQAGVDYEDVRVDKDEFQKIKASVVTELLPVLYVGEHELNGSGPICRYLAEEFNLAGKTALDRAKIGGAVDILDDLFEKMVVAFFGENQEKLKKELVDVHIPQCLRAVERMIVTNKSQGSWIFGNTVTYADLCLAVRVDEIIEKIPSLGESFPNVKKCIDSVKCLPNIVKWLEKRPKTTY